MKKLWKDIKIGDEFLDGSKVTSIHDSYIEDCYNVFFYKNFACKVINKKQNCVLSGTHLLLCDISKVSDKAKKWIEDNFSNYSIPTLYDKHVYYNNLDKLIEISNNGGKIYKDELYSILDQEHSEKYEVIQSDKSKISQNEYWLPINALFLLVRNFNEKILCNGNLIDYIEYFGKHEVFCIETDTHKYETCGLIHHNSVTLRNIIFHCLTHGEQICIALIDLKYTEFTYFKGVKNVVAVANTVREAAEIMRLGREVMYKRNQEMSKIGINDIKDFKPQKPTNEVIVAGRKLKDEDIVEIQLPNGEEKTVTVKELEQYL